MRGSLQAGSDRKGEFYQSAGFFIEWPSLMASLAQIGERFPDVRVPFPKMIQSFR